MKKGKESKFSVKKLEEQSVPFVFNSPHSGDQYPDEFQQNSRLSKQELRLSEDFKVDEIIEDVVNIGAALMIAHFPRAWLDVNREPYELDPMMFDATLPKFANSESQFVKAGLGTIARIVAVDKHIYKNKLKVGEALRRIENFYLPYHRTLKNLIDNTAKKFGGAMLIDCHSMPSSAKPDIILGNRYNATCNSEIMMEMKKLLEEVGYKVECNTLYAGGFITQHYGKPDKGIQAMQIEINRRLYMDEKNIKLNDGFNALKDNLNSVFRKFCNRNYQNLLTHAIAAQ